jgi:ABC-type spermidine/putrescine transport system permease subunit II
MKLDMPWAKLGLAATILIVLLPVAAVTLYALSERWDTGWLPQGATAHWMLEITADARIRDATLRTVVLAALSALLAVTCGASATVAACLHAPRLRAVLQAVAMLPYAIPPVVVAIGALELFVGRWGAWLDIRVVYVLLMAPLLFALVYKPVAGALDQLAAVSLLEAGRTLGASDLRVIMKVILPLLAPTLMASLLLCWMTACMEFVIANLMLGGSNELLQPLINSMRGANGHTSAALVLLSLLVLLACGAFVHFAAARGKGKI